MRITEARKRKIDSLVDAAISTLHHDGSDDEPAVIEERRLLTNKFAAILYPRRPRGPGA
jgi:hypothetical protein